MKITPVAPAVPGLSAEGNLAGYRPPPVIKMNVNQTPLANMPPQELMSERAQVETLPDAKLSNSPKDDQAGGDSERKPLSPQFAALARQRRELQKMKQELDQRQQALSQQTGRSDVIEKAKLEEDPIGVLLEAGITFDQLAEKLRERPYNPEVYAVKQEMQSLRKNFEEKLNEFSTGRQAQEEQQVYAEMQKEAEELAKSDDFELVREMGRIPSVLKLMDRYFRETGEVMDVREAMQSIEDELYKDMQRVTGFKKLQGVIQPPPAPVQSHQGMRTLTNSDTANPGPMSAKARALAKFYGR